MRRLDQVYLRLLSECMHALRRPSGRHWIYGGLESLFRVPLQRDREVRRQAQWQAGFPGQLKKAWRRTCNIFVGAEVGGYDLPADKGKEIAARALFDACVAFFITQVSAQGDWQAAFGAGRFGSFCS